MIAELKAERTLLKIDVDERIPYWMVRWKALTDWMVGIAHTVGWRDDAKVYVSEMVDMFLADEKAEAVPEMQRILLNINACCVITLYGDRPGHGVVLGDMNAPCRVITINWGDVHFDPCLPR